MGNYAFKDIGASVDEDVDNYGFKDIGVPVTDSQNGGK